MKRFLLSRVLWLAGIGFVLCTHRVFADDYLGAAAALDKIAHPSPPSSEPAKDSAAGLLKRDIASLQRQSGTLPPEAAAKQWLELLDRQVSLSLSTERISNAGSEGEDTFNPQDIWSAIPPPSAWNALRQAIEARPSAKTAEAKVREAGLRLIAHTLVTDYPAQTNDVADLESLFAKMNREDNYSLGAALDRINEQLLQRSEDPAMIMKSLERRLARAAQEESSDNSFSVPNLVPLVGTEKTEAFLRRVLSMNIELEVRQGEETEKLARRLALEMVDRLKVPQWGLACALDAGPLYEALEKRFAPQANETNAASVPDDPAALLHRTSSRMSSGGSREEARIYYLLGLVAQNRTREAVALSQKLGRNDQINVPRDALKQLERAGYAKATHDFFRELLSQNPNLPLWDEYIALAAQVRETEAMLELVRKAAAREDLSERQQHVIRQNFYKALLAAGEVDAGIAEIRQMLATPETRSSQRYDYDDDSPGNLAFLLAKLGQLLGRTNLTEEGIAATRKSLAESGASGPSEYRFNEQVGTFAEFLAENGRGPEAERLLIDTLAHLSQKKTDDSYALGSLGYLPQRVCLAALARIYQRAGRYADVILLLEQSPDWGAKDLADFTSRYFGLHAREDSLDDSLRYCAASSLVELGRKDTARRIVDAILDENGGYDPAYELLLKIGGSDVSARLDALFARDQFEERPLIWKAVILKQAGRLQDAEATVRHAIAVDPSDGEQGPGRRMRAYAVLADIRAARGDKAEAEVLLGAVEAIRLSEKADRYYEAGLLRQAVNMYEDSLLHFEAAYCIQSRLALRLSDLGQHKEAEEHYRRAYELMPDSFGRVESHCFGCERAFEGEPAERIAEKIFTSLTKATPVKPQSYYLLGYLREEQGRYGEALTCFREAARLDPDYLNAWKHIEIVGNEYPLKTTDRDAVILTILRLDPIGRHSECGNFREMTDLRALWNAVDTAAKLHPPRAETLYPLPASKAKLDKALSGLKGREAARARSMIFESTDNDGQTKPASAVMQTGIISAASSLFPEFSGHRGIVY